MGRVENCVFCDRTQFEDRVISEDNNFYFIATLGQISNSGYLLLIPKRHVLCVGAMGQKEAKVLEEAREKLDFALSKEYDVSPIMFEHGIVGQTIKHAHLHFVPEICDITERIRQDFLDKEIAEITSFSELQSLYAIREKPYLLWRNSDLETKICWDPKAPPQYFRTVLAEALKRPERGNWKDMDPKLDKQLRAETITRLRPYFKSSVR